MGKQSFVVKNTMEVNIYQWSDYPTTSFEWTNRFFGICDAEAVYFIMREDTTQHWLEGIKSNSWFMFDP